ncbi:PEP-CTERM sorting domain-containing protein [Akkermansiaceae bacterium]|nr:PEP-CTERM sorting domain-containing protein [Akkermansiaceae bacterium]
MNTKILLITTGTCIASHVNAAIIAQDDFTYADGFLHGNGSAGAGWAGGWVLDSGSGVTVENGAVADSVSGDRTRRNLTDTQGTDGTTIYIGFDHEFGTHYSAIEFNLGNANDTNFRLEFNNGFLGGTQFRANAAGGDALYVVNEAGIRRYVIQVDYGVGDADTATLFDNGVNVGSIDTTSTGGFAFNQISFGSFGGGSLDHTDNLIIATTFAEAIPEPSSAVLVLGGMMTLMLGHRRR